MFEENSNHQPNILLQFFSFLLVILVVEVAAGCWVYTNLTELESMLQDHVTNTVQHEYGTNDYRTVTFDTIQKHVSLPFQFNELVSSLESNLCRNSIGLYLFCSFDVVEPMAQGIGVLLGSINATRKVIQEWTWQSLHPFKPINYLCLAALLLPVLKYVMMGPALALQLIFQLLCIKM